MLDITPVQFLVNPVSCKRLMTDFNYLSPPVPPVTNTVLFSSEKLLRNEFEAIVMMLVKTLAAELNQLRRHCDLS